MRSRQIAYLGVSAFILTLGAIACGPDGRTPDDDSAETGGNGPSGTGGQIDASGGAPNTSTGGAFGASGETSTGGTNSSLLPHEEIEVQGVVGPYMKPRILTDEYVYFTTAAQEDQFSTVLTARLWRVPKAGGAAENLTAQDEEGIFAVGADLDYVYFFRDGSTDFFDDLSGWNGWRKHVHRVAIDGALPAAHQELTEEQLGTNGWGGMLAQTDELFVATYSEEASNFRLVAFDKETGSMVYDRFVSDYAGAVSSVRQTGNMAVVYTTANTFFSLDLRDGSATLLGTAPNLCRVVGPDVENAAWFALCTADDLVSVARIEDDGSYEVLGESLWTEELGISGVFGEKVVQVQGNQVFAFDTGTAQLETLTLQTDDYPFGLDAQHVYFLVAGEMWRSRYSDEAPVTVEPTCVALGGVPACDSLDEQACGSTPGCAFAPGCSGEGSSCEEFSLGCEYYGCTPGETEFDSCTGDITCADQGTSTACAGWSCDWSDCLGTPEPCSDLSLDDCSTAPHCDLVY